MSRPRHRLIPHLLVLLVLLMLLAACSAGLRPADPAGAPGPAAAEPAAPGPETGSPAAPDSTPPPDASRGPWDIDPADVAWIRLALGLPVYDSPRPLYPHRAADQELISRLLDWLGRAEAVADSTAEPPRRGIVLQIRLRSGETLAVAAGVQMHREERPDGVVITGTPARDQVVVSAAGRRQVLYAPLLRGFVTGGWQRDLDVEPELAVEPAAVAPGQPFTVTGGGGAWAEGRSATIYLVGPGPHACCDPDTYPSPQSVLLGVVPVVDGAFTYTGSLAREMGPTPDGGLLTLQPGPQTLQVAVSGAGGRTLSVTLTAEP